MRTNLAKSGIPNVPQSADVRQNLDGGITNFQISGQLLKMKIVINPEPVMICT